MKYKALTDQIIGAFYHVYNTLGYGFLEKVYEQAMIIELTKRGLHVQSQYPIRVFYKDHVVGEFFADLLVNDKVIVEVKAVRELATEHEAQVLSYLNATSYEVGLLLNFGPKAQVKRKIFDNHHKKYHRPQL